MAKTLFRSYGWILTHLVAASVGGAVWFAVRAEKADAVKSTPVASQKASSRAEVRRDRPDRSIDGDKILSDITGEQHRSSMAPNRKFSYADHIRESAERVIKEANELPPADDVAAAALEALDFMEKFKNGGTFTKEMMEERQKLPAKILHWIRKDPQAAIAHLGSLNQLGYYNGAIMAAVYEQGPVEALKWPMPNKESNQMSFRYMIAAEAGRRGDSEVVAAFKQGVSANEWSNSVGMLVESWPPEKRDELFKAATGENSPAMLTSFIQRRGIEGYQWLKTKLESDDLDPAFKQAVLKDSGYRQMVRNTPEIPFEERIEILAGFNKDKPVEQLQLEIGGADVTRFLAAGRDWKYAFHTGNATMEEIYQAAAAGLPELAKSSPDALRNQIYKELAQENPQAALASVDAFSGGDKWGTAMKAARWMFKEANPQVFYDYVTKIPVETSETSWQDRLGAWNESARDAYAKLGPEYSNWVLALPEGMDKEMASYNLLKQVRDKESDVAKSLREQVKDPRLIEKMNAKP